MGVRIPPSSQYCSVAQLVERFHYKEEDVGSSPIGATKIMNMENNILLSEVKDIREKTIKKWKESGWLDGIVKGDIKNNIAELYECCKSSSLDEDK